MRTENGMETAVRKEINELSRMTVGQLRQKYQQVFGEESRSNHKQFLFRRIAGEFRRWRRAGCRSVLAPVRWKSPMMRIFASGRRKMSFGSDVTMTPGSALLRLRAFADTLIFTSLDARNIR